MNQPGKSDYEQSEPPTGRRDIASIVAQLQAMDPTADGRATQEETILFSRMLGLDPPSDDPAILPPSETEIVRLRLWIEDVMGVSERERVDFFRAFHRSAAWRAVISDLSIGLITKRRGDSQQQSES